VNEEGLRAVRNYLAQPDIQIVGTSLGGDFVRARASVQTWERLFDGELHVYKAHHRKAPHTMADYYSVPGKVADHVYGILGMADFPIEHLERKTNKARPEVVV